ncbi:N-acetylmuramoyl-L-alanine amidase [Desulfotomaculum sp. 1211_IL3151]|uniref:N-acetylmuramoyl-L-alanine amidase n=1 Tax=Desulfotomaculum sp. 1211_IL3151 TaxID=3084055 RepID=UPI002FDAFDE2
MTIHLKSCRFYRYAILVGLGLSLLFNPFGAVQAADAAQMAIVNGDKINLRSGPGANTALVGQSDKGAQLPILAKNGDWYKVQFNGKEAWVAGWLVNVKTTPTTSTPGNNTATPQTNTKVAVVNGDSLNVRNGPSTTNNVVGNVKKGEKLTILEQKGDWYKVQGTNITGWVASWLVTVQNKPDTPPPVTTPPATSKPTTDNQVAVINTDNLNLRSGPGTDHGVAGQVSRGIRLPIISRSGQWVQVKQTDGSTAWVAGWLVSVVDQPEPPQPKPTSSGGYAWLPSFLPDDPDDNEKTNENTPPEDKQHIPGAKLLDVQVVEEGDHTYINIVSDKDINHNTFTLSNPFRFVVNLNDVSLNDKPSTISAETGLVSQIRTGYNEDPYYSRLVIDLKEQARVKVSLANDKKSLTLDISKISYSDGMAGKTVFLDAGHGGKDNGASGQNGLREKDVNLDITLKVADLLKRQGANVIFSRADDQFIDLYERTRMANEQSADIFVSIHSNANTNRSIAGTSTYYYAPSTIPNLYQQKDDRYRLAQDVQRELVATLGRRDIGVLQSNFAVLRTSMMPSILVETAFVSNAEEEALLGSEEFRERAATAIVNGISAYFDGK